MVPDELKAKFDNFPPIFKKNTEVGIHDIEEYIRKYAIENDLLKHPQRMLVSNSKLENASIITLFNFYMELVYSVQKFTALYRIPLENTSTGSLFSQLLMQEVKETRTLYPELLQRL